MKSLRGCLGILGVVVLVFVAMIWGVFFRNTRAPFDAVNLAQSETRMWKAYYAKDAMELHGELNLMLHNQFGLSRYRTWQVSTKLSLASMDFARSGGRLDASTREGLLTELAGAYAGIRAATGLPFDPREAAEAELAWWVARRTQGANSVEQVGAKIEALYAVLYGRSNEQIASAATLRAEAAKVRDETANWPEVERLLVQSYRALLLGIDM